MNELIYLAIALGILLISFILIRKRIAPRLGLQDLRRNNNKYLGGIAGMITCMIYSNLSSLQFKKVRFLILAVVLLVPEGAGLFMYLLVWAIIPKDKTEPELSVS